MKKLLVVIGALLMMGFGTVYAAQMAPKKVVDFANATLAKIGSDPAIIAAVEAANAKGITMDQIKAMDKKWKAESGLAGYMKAMMDSPCGKHLAQLKNKDAAITEIFVMGNQGGNVCMTDKTGDFWQGDEAKFKKSFKGGAGAVFVDEVEMENNMSISQVSVPVIKDGKAIGAITFGVNVDKVK